MVKKATGAKKITEVNFSSESYISTGKRPLVNNYRETEYKG